MANPDAVGQNTPDSFGNYAIASATGVSLATTGNAVVSLPILKGGLTAGNSVATSGAIIVRRVTIQNPSASVSTGNITILSSNDGNTSNAVVAAVTLGSLTGTGTFQDVAISGGNVIVSGYNTQALYVKVGTAVTGTVDIRVYGDTVNF
jgi:co-chaperonin GroES (HSP10)